MPNPRLAERYAKSLIDIAVETHSLEEVYTDLNTLIVTCDESRDFENFLRSPIINREKKEKIFTAIFKDNLVELTKKFIILLIKKGREGALPEILDAAISQYKTLKNIRDVKMTTAIPLSKELNDEIVKKIKQEIPGYTIELKTKVKENILGGFVLETDNTIYDASVIRKLRDVKTSFIKQKTR